MIIALVFYAALMSEMGLSMSNPTVLEVTILEASQVDNGTEGIFGGEVAESHAYPWQVRLRILRPQLEVGCGGSIICPRFVLTAAHCVDRVTNINQLIVRAGINRLCGDPSEQRSIVNRITIHPNYIPLPTLTYDYAILELRTPIIIGAETRPIFLPLPNEPELSIRGTRFAASGWGRTETSNPPQNLRVISLYQYTLSECNVRNPSEFCAGQGEPGRGTCNGDSGGIKNYVVSQNSSYF